MRDQLSDGKQKYCSVCGEPATDIICQPCKAKIHGEAAHRKQQIDKEVSTDTSRK
jgi:predicted amidophosphoribosyltransferase